MVIIVTARTMVVDMSRSEGVLRIVKDGIFGTRQEEHLLREIKDVFVDTSRSSKGGRTYRIVIQLNDGAYLPLSRVYSSGLKDKLAAAEAMKEFLAPYQNL